jgi:hypothetical protein
LEREKATAAAKKKEEDLKKAQE